MSTPLDEPSHADPTGADNTFEGREVDEEQSDPIAPLGASNAPADVARVVGGMQPEDDARDSDGVPVGRADARADEERSRSAAEPPQPMP